jgi:hypothetical protein
MPEFDIHNSEEAQTRQRPANREPHIEYRHTGHNPLAALVPAGAGRIFSNCAIANIANAPARTATLQAMQRTHGNRAVQRHIRRDRAPDAPGVSVQRQLFDDELGPGIYIGPGWGTGGGGGYSSQPAPAPAPAPAQVPATPTQEEPTETNPTISLGIPFTDYTLHYTMPWWPGGSSDEPEPAPAPAPEPEPEPEEEEAERNLRISMGIPFTDYEAQLTLPWF